jgi:hypothetical protein
MEKDAGISGSIQILEEAPSSSADHSSPSRLLRKAVYQHNK